MPQRPHILNNSIPTMGSRSGSMIEVRQFPVIQPDTHVKRLFSFRRAVEN